MASNQVATVTKSINVTVSEAVKVTLTPARCKFYIAKIVTFTFNQMERRQSR